MQSLLITVVSTFEPNLPDDIVILPICVTAESVIFTESVTNGVSINISREDLPGIYLGFIQTWDNPFWKSSNKNFNMPPLNVFPLHRTEKYGSSSSTLFLKTLTSFSPIWPKQPDDNEVAWPVPNPSDYNNLPTPDAMITAVSNKKGALGYISSSITFLNGSSETTVACVENQMGEFIQPGPVAFEKIVENVILTPENLRDVSLIDLNCSGCYPISSFEYVLYKKEILSKNCSEAIAFSSFLTFLFSSKANQLKLEQGFGNLNDSANQMLADLINEQSKTCLCN